MPPTDFAQSDARIRVCCYVYLIAEDIERDANTTPASPQ
ncbi:unnamed protein product [Ectocarpus sp. CCAP 1310/34]|nr:unnamed protein product [Ectocarpus sp. CCAP 1310/34]